MTTEIDPSEIRGLLDREAIRDCVLRYARGLDREDEEVLLSAFHPDARDDHGSFIGPIKDFPGRASATRHRWKNYQHHVTNQTVEIDGDGAHAESYYIASLVRPDDSLNLTGGRYLDRLECIGGKWAISDRIVIVEWAVTVPAEQAGGVPQGLFVSSAHDRSDPSYRRPLEVTRKFRNLSAS